MVKVRFSHLQALDPNNIFTWLDSITNRKFQDLLHTHYPYYYSTLFHNENLRDEVKLTILYNSCELVEILDSLALDEQTLLAAFYYPLVAQGVVELKEVQERLSPLMNKIMKGTLNMSQIDIINFNSKEGNQLSSIRHLLLSMADDYRSIIIKLAERILFLRVLDSNKSLNQKEKASIAYRISEVYASLANRLSVGQLKWEIEDLCLKICDPDSYYSIVKSLGLRRIERLRICEDFVAKLKERILKETSLTESEFEVYARPKHIYSIHKKMQRKNLRFEQLYDLFASRVIVNTVEECYAILSMVQADYTIINSEYTDYIANPKPNGYQSLHTMIKLNERFSMELQIRTKEMHKHAEMGVAAHWVYKEGGKTSNKANDKIAWLRKLLDWQKEISTNQDPKIEAEIRQQLLNDRVYIFTPREEVRDLPIGATPLDFAYSIHTDVGHRCSGAKVNNKIVNFSYQLQTGDKVEILTSKEPNVSPDWVNFVKTQRAKSKIQGYFSKINRDHNIKEGLAFLEKTFEAYKLPLKNNVPLLLKRFKNCSNFEDLCLNFGNGTFKATTLHNFLDTLQGNDPAKANAAEADQLIQLRISGNSHKHGHHSQGNSKNQIEIEGSGSVLYSLAKCCRPIPGDPIIGYITKGRGVSVHKADCVHVNHLIKTSPGRIVSTTWNRNFKQNNVKMRARIQVLGLDRVGMLRDISAALSSDKVTIVSFNSKLNSKTMLSQMNFEVDFASIEVLNKVLLSISKISGVVQAIRL